MFANTKAFSGFAVDDLEAAKKFYGDTLGAQPGQGLLAQLADAVPSSQISPPVGRSRPRRGNPVGEKGG